jgi:hypothetical protein
MPDNSGTRKIPWPEPPLAAANENGKRGGVREGESMTRRSAAVGVVLASAFALTLEGCAGSATVTSALLCENTGGKYVNRTCTPGTSRRAEDMCAGFGGTYSAKEDECTIPSKTP